MHLTQRSSRMKKNPIYQEYLAEVKDAKFLEKDYDDKMSYVSSNYTDLAAQDDEYSTNCNERYMEDE